MSTATFSHPAILLLSGEFEKSLIFGANLAINNNFSVENFGKISPKTLITVAEILNLEEIQNILTSVEARAK